MHAVKKLLAGGLLAAGIVGSLVAPAVAADGQADVVVGTGSDTTYHLMADLDKLYNGAVGCNTTPASGQSNRTFRCLTGAAGDELRGNADHDVVTEHYPQGSSNGISHLANVGNTNVTKVDFARSSRARRSTDAASLRFIAVGREGMSWSYVSHIWIAPTNLPSNLTQSQLNGIYVTCTITNWNQVGGPNRPIVVYTAQAGSGTRSEWDTFVGGNSDSCIPAALKDGNAANGERVVFENAGSLVDPKDWGGAILPYSLGRHAENGGQGFRLGSVNGVPANVAEVKSGRFPFIRNVYNVVRTDIDDTGSQAAALDYLGIRTSGAAGWLCRPPAEHVRNAETGRSYADDITRIFEAHGFSQFDQGTTGGGVPGQSRCRVS